MREHLKKNILWSSHARNLCKPVYTIVHILQVTFPFFLAPASHHSSFVPCASSCCLCLLSSRQTTTTAVARWWLTPECRRSWSYAPSPRWRCRCHPEWKRCPPLVVDGVLLPAIAGLGRRHGALPSDHPSPNSRRIRCSPQSLSTGPSSRPGSDRKAAEVPAATEGALQRRMRRRPTRRPKRRMADEEKEERPKLY